MRRRVILPRRPLSALLPGAAALAWWDIADLSRLRQDRAGTVPVTAPGQPIGMILDASGFGLHLTAISDAARATYQSDGARHWAAFSGAVGGYVTGTVTPGVDKVAVVAAVRKATDASTGTVIEHSTTSTGNAGTFAMFTALAGAANFVFGSRGSAATRRDASAASVAPATAVVSGLGDIAGDRAAIRLNGVDQPVTTTDQGAGTFAAQPMYVGSRGGTTNRLTGDLFALVVRFSAVELDAARLAQAERWAARRAGLVL